MSAKNKKASREKRMSRGRKIGVGKPIGICATWFNGSGFGAVLLSFAVDRQAIFQRRILEDAQAAAA